MKTLRNSFVARAPCMAIFLHFMIGWIISEGSTSNYLSILLDIRRIAVMLIMGYAYAYLTQKSEKNK